ncbi:hypothetical protein F385_1471 [Pantoea agglomerans 299R]|nr:hypothetical protein F385_1471 [Pantoea agglomerans 299R]
MHTIRIINTLANGILKTKKNAHLNAYIYYQSGSYVAPEKWHQKNTRKSILSYGYNSH